MAIRHSTARPRGIYQIRCKNNNKVYIGSAVVIDERWRLHRLDLNRGTHPNRYLQSSWRKYGADAFVFEILQIVENKEDLIRIEQEWFDRVRPFDRRIGFNLSPTAGSSLGVKHTPETRAKYAAIKRGLKASPETRAKMSASRMGLKLSDESRAKISAKAKGRQFSAETRMKIASAFKGKKLTAEHRANISAAMIGIEVSAEHRANLSAAMTGNRNGIKRRRPGAGQLSFLEDSQ